MSDQSLENRPLRDLCSEAEHLSRSMIEHLEQGFLPKIGSLSRTVLRDERSGSDAQLEDIAIRNSTAEVLRSEGFTKKLDDDLVRHLTVIDKNVADITGQRGA